MKEGMGKREPPGDVKAAVDLPKSQDKPTTTGRKSTGRTRGESQPLEGGKKKKTQVGKKTKAKSKLGRITVLAQKKRPGRHKKPPGGRGTEIPPSSQDLSGARCHSKKERHLQWGFFTPTRLGTGGDRPWVKKNKKKKRSQKKVERLRQIGGT